MIPCHLIAGNKISNQKKIENLGKDKSYFWMDYGVLLELMFDFVDHLK